MPRARLLSASGVGRRGRNEPFARIRRRSRIKIGTPTSADEAHAVFFDVPPEVCIGTKIIALERNVPEDVFSAWQPSCAAEVR